MCGSSATGILNLRSGGRARGGAGPADTRARIFYASEHVFAKHVAPGGTQSSSYVAADEPPLLLVCRTIREEGRNGQKANCVCSDAFLKALSVMQSPTMRMETRRELLGRLRSTLVFVSMLPNHYLLGGMVHRGLFHLENETKKTPHIQLLFDELRHGMGQSASEWRRNHPRFYPNSFISVDIFVIYMRRPWGCSSS